MNDFKEKHAYIEYHSYGQGHLQIFNFSTSGGIHRGFNLSDDHIFVFLNYNQLGKFKDKEQAVSLINKLFNDCPKECKQDFDNHKEKLLETLK